MPSLRTLICAAALAAAALAAPLSANAESIASEDSPSVNANSCSVSGGSVTFVSKMKSIENGSTLKMKLELQRRALSGGDWSSVSAPGFGQWYESPSTAKNQIYIISQPISGLSIGNSYRVRVSFLWIAKSGRVLRSVEDVKSPACDQPDPRPDLYPTLSSVKKGPGGNAQYTVALRNTGLGAAPAFSTALRVNGIDRPVLVASGLGAGKSGALGFTAPSCIRGTKLRIEVDSMKLIAERDETNNVIEPSCPL